MIGAHYETSDTDNAKVRIRFYGEIVAGHKKGHHLMKPTGEVRQLKGRKRQSVVIIQYSFWA
jgi:hypothetical protein